MGKIEIHIKEKNTDTGEVITDIKTTIAEGKAVAFLKRFHQNKMQVLFEMAGGSGRYRDSKIVGTNPGWMKGQLKPKKNIYDFMTKRNNVKTIVSTKRL